MRAGAVPRAGFSAPGPGRVDVEMAVRVDRVEHPPVVGDEQQRAVVGRRAACSSCSIAGQVEVVRRLVEDEQVDAAAPAAARARRGCARRARASGRRPQHVVGAQPELGEQGADVGRRPVAAPAAAERLAAAARSPRNSAAGLVDLADDDARARARRCRRRAAIRPSSAASRVDLPAPLAPVIATRSAQSICRSPGRG